MFCKGLYADAFGAARSHSVGLQPEHMEATARLQASIMLLARAVHQIWRRLVWVPHSSAVMAAAARCSVAAPLPLPIGGFSTRASVMCRMSGSLETQGAFM